MRVSNRTGSAIQNRTRERKPSAKGTEATQVQILIVDDHPIIREGLIELINRHQHLKVKGEASDVESALDQIHEHTFDLVIVDLALKGRSGLELIKYIHDQDASLPILVFSVYEEPFYAERALRAGAKGYVMKQEAADKIVSAIEHVLRNELYVSSPVSEKIHKRFFSREIVREKSLIERLSDRELEVFHLIGQGYGTRQIADVLHLSIKTIESYRANIKEKLHLQSGGELVHRAVIWVNNVDLC